MINSGIFSLASLVALIYLVYLKEFTAASVVFVVLYLSFSMFVNTLISKLLLKKATSDLKKALDKVKGPDLSVVKDD